VSDSQLEIRLQGSAADWKRRNVHCKIFYRVDSDFAANFWLNLSIWTGDCAQTYVFLVSRNRKSPKANYGISESRSGRCFCGARGASLARSAKMAGSGLTTVFRIRPWVANWYPHSEHVWIGDGV